MKGFWDFNKLLIIPFLFCVLALFVVLYNAFLQYPLISAVFGTFLAIGYIFSLYLKDVKKRRNKS
jgi:hypothetical protein